MSSVQTRRIRDGSLGTVYLDVERSDSIIRLVVCPSFADRTFRAPLLLPPAADDGVTADRCGLPGHSNLAASAIEPPPVDPADYQVAARVHSLSRPFRSVASGQERHLDFFGSDRCHVRRSTRRVLGLFHQGHVRHQPSGKQRRSRQPDVPRRHRSSSSSGTFGNP